MNKIGVIVPVYNVEKYLRRSLDSILRQTHSDLLLHLVNDGSSDRSGEICDEYARRDSRVHVTHLNHVGVSGVRNEGVRWILEESDCQWLVFIDSDDWIHPQTLERLYQAAQMHQVKLSLCNYGETKDETDPWGDTIADAQLLSPENLYLHHFITATIPVAKLYHRTCFAGKTYPVGKIHEDEYITFHILFEQKQVAFIDSPMYAYYYNPVSITKRPWSPERLDAWDAYEDQIRFFTDRGNRELVDFRYRGYLENIRVNLAEADAYPDQAALGPVRRRMKRRIRSVIRRAWKRGIMDFWIEQDLLIRFYPLTTKIYRFLREHGAK